MPNKNAFIEFIAAYLVRHADRSGVVNAAQIVSLCAQFQAGVPLKRIIRDQDIRDFRIDARLPGFAEEPRRFWRVLATKGKKKKICFLRHQGGETYGHYIDVPRGFKVRSVMAVTRAERDREMLKVLSAPVAGWMPLA